MIQELFQLYADRWQFFLKLTLQHLEISLIAIVAALCIGLSLGILISSYRRSSSLVLGLTNFMYTIPSIALFGFLIPFSGIGDTTAIFALTVYALLPMVRNTIPVSPASTGRSSKPPAGWEVPRFRFFIKSRFRLPFR